MILEMDVLERNLAPQAQDVKEAQRNMRQRLFRTDVSHLAVFPDSAQ
jgi:hypothetical protein